MMGIKMPETCCDRSLIMNIGLVASCWFISLHLTFHDSLSQEPKTYLDQLLNDVWGIATFSESHRHHIQAMYGQSHTHYALKL